MALRLASSSPASSIRRRDPAPDALGSKRRLISVVDPFAFEEKGDLELEERVWKMLLEDIFDVILASLPFAARSRFGCICRKWKDVRCPPLSCTIMSRWGDSNAKLYCTTEKKWFCLPSNGHLSIGRFWELADVDAGLFCYQCNVNDQFWLCESNPLKSSLVQLIKPDYPLWDPNVGHSPCAANILVYRAKMTHKVKLLVDRAKRSTELLR